MSKVVPQAWRRVALGECVDLLTGFPFKSARFTEEEGDVRLLRGDNVAQGTLRWDGVKRWAASDLADYRQFKLEADDVILAMDRPWIPAGLKWAWVRRSDLPCLLVQRVARMRGVNGLDTSFLRYLIASPQFTAHVQSITTGVNVPHISGRDIKAFEFRLPPLPLQRRIAEILGAYDDLIENNTRRIAILEKMARQLYEEWFVRFRFPGHERVRTVSSSIGMIPDDWEVVDFGQIAEVSGSTITPASRPDQIFAHFSIPAFDAARLPVVEAGALIMSNKLAFEPPCVLLSKLNPRIPRVWWVRGRTEYPPVCSTELLPLSAKPPYSPTMLAAVCGSAEFAGRFAGLANGTSTSHQRVKPKDVLQMLVARPPDELLCRADQTIAPVFQLADTLRQKSANLRTQRDLLLPKLVSGEIDVSEAPAAQEAAA